MKILLITNPGIEDISALEVKELLSKDANSQKNYVTFETEDPKDLIKLCYISQSVSKVMILLDSFVYKDNLLEQLKGRITKETLRAFFSEAYSFNIKTVKQNFCLDVSSPEILEVISQDIQKDFSWTGDYKNPEVQFLVFLTEKECFIGIDFCQLDLDKRHYKIFQVQPPLKAPLAYALGRLTQHTNKKLLLDPNCGSGLIAIEAALHQRNFSVNYFDKDKLKFPPIKDFPDEKKIMEQLDKKIKPKSKPVIHAYSSSFQHINASKKNAKIAGINDSIQFSRQDLDWLELKFDKSSIDCIATVPLQYGQHSNIKNIEKWYDEFFKEAEFILKPKSKIALLSRKTDLIKKYAEKYHFNLEEERKVMQGKETLAILVYMSGTDYLAK